VLKVVEVVRVVEVARVVVAPEPVPELEQRSMCEADIRPASDGLFVIQGDLDRQVSRSRAF
jgi:hypothetical protein